MKDACGLCSILESGEVSKNNNTKSRQTQFTLPTDGSMVESIVGAPSKLDSIAELREEEHSSSSLREDVENEKKDEPCDAPSSITLVVDTSPMLPTAESLTASPTKPVLVFDSPKAAAQYRAAKACAAAAAVATADVDSKAILKPSDVPIVAKPANDAMGMSPVPSVVDCVPSAIVTLERDFDKSPTDLYLSLMRKDWSAAIRRCAERPEEAKTWIYRKETTGALRWKLLPLHASIIFNAPFPVVDALVHSFPEGAVCKDDQGMVPLHLAIRMNSDQTVVEKLVAAQPDAISVTDRKGRTPKALAEKQVSCPKTLLVIQTLDNASIATNGSSKGKLQQPKAAPLVAPASPIVVHKQQGVAYASPKAASEAKKVAAAVAAATLATIDNSTAEMSPKAAAAVKDVSEQWRISYQEDAEKLSRGASDKQQQLIARIDALECEALASKETIVSLEESLKKFDYREAELKSKIADLEVTVADTIKDKTLSDDSNKAVITNLVSQIGDLQSKLTTVTSARDSALTSHTNYEEASKQEMAKMKLKGLEVVRQLCQVTFLKDEKTEALLKAEKFIVQQKGQISLLQDDVVALRAKLDTTERKLEEVTISEQELAWRNNAFVLKLNGGGTTESEESGKSSTEHIESLERERDELRETVNKLSVKLYKVVGFLDEMVQEQEAIISETMTRDSEAMIGPTDEQTEDRSKLISNVTGMKEQIIGVIDSVIEGMPQEELDVDMDMDEVTKPPSAVLQ